MASKRPSMRDRVREQAQKSTTEGASYLKLPGKVNFFQPKAEEYDLDCIPFENDKDNHPKGYEKGELIPFIRFKVHSGIGAEDNKYICPTSVGKKCPICEERSRMAKSANGDPDLIKALTPKDRCLFQVIDLKEEKKGVQLFDHSYHLFAKKLLGDIDKAENSTSGRKRSIAHAGFAELEEGQTLFASFVEKKMGTNKFYECDRIDAGDREPYGEEILDEVLNLDDCLKILPYDELEAIFLELDPEEQGSNRKRDDKEEKEEPSRGSRRGGKKEEAEEEPPTRRRGSKKEEQEEKEEPTPTRRRSAAKEEPAEEEEPPTRSSRRGAAKADDAEETPARSSRRGKPEQEEEPPARSRRGAAKEEKKDDRCWVEGGVFGKDCDKHVAEDPEPNCYSCPDATYDACRAAQDAMK